MKFDHLDLGFWVGTLIGVAGLIFAFWSYYKTKITRKLEFVSYGRSLVDPEALKVGDYEFLVNGRRMTSLSREYILLASTGSHSVQFSEILNHATFEVHEGAEIIAAGLLQSDDPDNSAHIEFTPKKATIKFEYLRPRDAVLFYVDHTGFDRSALKISISEKERDIVSRRALENIGFKSYFKTLDAVGLSIATFAMALIYVFFLPLPPRNFDTISWGVLLNTLSFMPMFFPFLLYFVFIFYLRRRNNYFRSETILFADSIVTNYLRNMPKT